MKNVKNICSIKIKELETKIALREQIIENQRLLIELLRNELKRKCWYNFWKKQR